MLNSSGKHGAAAFVVMCVMDKHGRFESTLIGARAIFVEKARSAFHMEVLAIYRAIEFIMDVIRHPGTAGTAQPLKRH